MKKTLFFAGLFPFLVLVMAATYLISQTGLSELTPAFRAAKITDQVTPPVKKECTYIKLDQGVISYCRTSPPAMQYPSPEPVVLIHGFSTPKIVFDKNVEVLVAAGFEVITFDHYGRGYSDRPDAKYDKDFFDRELLDFLDRMEIHNPVSLAGYSLGGGIAAVFASRHPERVKAVALIAPAGYMPKQGGVNSLLYVPFMGEWLMAVIGKKNFVASFKKDVDAGFATEEMLRLYTEQFRFRGTTSALLSTIRHYPMDNLSWEYEKLGRSKIPVLLLWGTKDDYVPYEGNEKIRKAVPGLTFAPVEGAGHSVVYSHPDEVNRALVSFFKGMKK